MHKLIEWWSNRDEPTRKKIRNVGFVVGLILIITAVSFIGRGEKHKKLTKAAPQDTTIQNPDLMAADTEDQINSAKKDMEKKQQEIVASLPSLIEKALKGHNAALEKADETKLSATAHQQSQPRIRVQAPTRSRMNQHSSTTQQGGYPSAPGSRANIDFSQSGQAPSQQAAVPQTVEAGAINYQSNPNIGNPTGTVAKNDHAKVQTLGKIKLVPGFMPAKLLVGLDASTSDGGKGQPKVFHLRVQAPATLPNDIKMNLKGCLAIANGWGNLASERIETQTVSIHCITMDGKTMIDGPLKGYVADKDGKRDMSGIVVTKAGRLLAASIFASAMQSLGSTISDSAGESSTSAFGSVKTFNGKDIAKAGVADGVAGGFKTAADFLNKLLTQTVPVIEVGAAKDVMIMVQDTSELTITHLEE